MPCPIRMCRNKSYEHDVMVSHVHSARTRNHFRGPYHSFLRDRLSACRAAQYPLSVLRLKRNFVAQETGPIAKNYANDVEDLSHAPLHRPLAECLRAKHLL